MTIMNLKHLNATTLEKDPISVLMMLQYANDSGIDVRELINDRPYGTWQGNMLFALIYLVGEQKPHSLTMDLTTAPPNAWYGKEVPYLEEPLGIHILHELIKAGVDIYDTDYYGKTIKDLIFAKDITYRIHNDIFRQFVLEIYNNKKNE